MVPSGSGLGMVVVASCGGCEASTASLMLIARFTSARANEAMMPLTMPTIVRRGRMSRVRPRRMVP